MYMTQKCDIRISFASSNITSFRAVSNISLMFDVTREISQIFSARLQAAGLSHTINSLTPGLFTVNARLTY